MSTFSGTFIKELRKSYNLTINHVTEKTGLSRSYISMVENGIRFISVENIFKLYPLFSSNEIRQLLLLRNQESNNSNSENESSFEEIISKLISIPLSPKIPLYSPKISADELTLVETAAIPSLFELDQNTYGAIKITEYSMLGVFELGDVLIFKKQDFAEPKQIILATLDNSLYVKIFAMDPRGTILLKSVDSTVHENIAVFKNDNFIIQGIITIIIKNYVIDSFPQFKDI